jgi:hypothetical protein
MSVNDTDATRLALARPVCRITREVLDQINNTIGSRPAEHGGILGGDLDEGIVRHFHFDLTGRRTGVTYSPDVRALTRLFKDVWKPSGVRMLGFVHSHPRTCRRPSSGDLAYSQDILERNDQLSSLLLLIVVSEVRT